MQPIPNEAALIQAAQQGDKKAVSTLYEAYAQGIYRYISYRVESDVIAEDLTSEVFLKMIRNLPRFQQTGAPFVAWLYRIAATQVADFYRAGKRYTQQELSDEQANDDTDPLNSIDREEERETLRAALQKLSQDHQNLLILRFMQNLPHHEVAEIMGKSEANIRVMQHRALKALAEQLGADGKARSYLRGEES
jgi:RNA polymerase sigma-70 factor, ECF subfamily